MLYLLCGWLSLLCSCRTTTIEKPEEGTQTEQEESEVLTEPASEETDSAPIEDTASTEDTDQEVVEIEKSSKRGLAYNLLDEEDIAALSSGVSWWYNWYFRSDIMEDLDQEYQMEFVPMLWGYNAEADYVALEEWFVAHPETDSLLLLNEPNLVDQANMTPQAAVAYWKRYEEFQEHMLNQHNRYIRLIGPAMTWGTLPNYSDPVLWLDDFYAAFIASEGREPIIDALAFHWYDYGLDGQLTRLEKYGKPFWVTEMANWHSAWDWTIDTPEKQMQTMIEMVSICESRDDVERYAWFIGRWNPDPHYTSIFQDAPGVLTPLGEAYLLQPY